MIESELHDIIIREKDIRISILDLYDFDFEKGFNYIHEHRLNNGLIVDFTVICNNKVVLMIECKGSNINLTDFVRGLGQVNQYRAILNDSENIAGIEIDSNFRTVLMFPSSLLVSPSFDIAHLSISTETDLVEINEDTYHPRVISRKELMYLAKVSKSGIKTISQYYFRDNRFYELYILLRYCSYHKIIGSSKIDRKATEYKFLRKLNTANNKNWRNAFITLSSLGFIDSNNLSTRKGILISHKNYESFLYEMITAYAYPYIQEIFEVFDMYDITPFQITNEQLSTAIKSKYQNQDVLFLTESDNRYISSWLNILRDDFGCIRFTPRSKKREILYNPLQFNEVSFRKAIQQYSKAYTYIDRYVNLIGGTTNV